MTAGGPPPVSSWGAASLLLLLALAAPAPTQAGHAQPAHGAAIAFDHRTGNAWWVEVVLSGSAASSVAGVQAMDTGGSWVPLAKKAWGAWAASFHIEAGHQVRFRATWPGGDQALSCWFDHPSGAERCSDAFQPAFTNAKGNDWWVEVKVAADRPLAGVDARTGCDGAWRPLALRSWGNWAASFHVPPGSTVDFRARASDGSTAVSPAAYVWPQATPTAPCPGGPQPFQAAFSNVKGNDWWVEARVTANQALSGVDARVGCDSGTWRPLTLRSWGSWAASFHVPPGSVVDLRARSAGGAVDGSDGAYVWPQATPTSACGAPWPREGSSAQVRFRGEEQWSDVDGTHLVRVDGLVTAQYAGGAWQGTCELRRDHRDGAGRWTNGTETWTWDRAPPRGERGFTDGTADVETVESCAAALYPEQPVVGRERRTFSVRSSDGDPVAIDAHHAHDEGPTHRHDFWWDARHGLVLSWRVDTLGSNPRHAEGWLLATDAPFA